MHKKTESFVSSCTGTGITGRIAYIAGGIAETVFPRACPVCGDLLRPEEGLIHRSCFDRLSFTAPPVCTRCGKQIITQGQLLCRDCAANERHFIRSFTTLNYDDTSRRITASLKYHNQRCNAEFLGKLMAYRNKDGIEDAHIDFIVPVPVSESRYRERRYNQAELIADTVGKELSVPVYPQVLIRKKQTKAMKDLNAGDRHAEMKNAIRFGELPEELKQKQHGKTDKQSGGKNKKSGAGLRALIVDDIYTTGATMEACAYILWSEGIESYAACACIGSDF